MLSRPELERVRSASALPLSAEIELEPPNEPASDAPLPEREGDDMLRREVRTGLEPEKEGLALIPMSAKKSSCCAADGLEGWWEVIRFH